MPTLKVRHDELRTLMATMRGLIANDEIDREAVTRTRLELDKVSTARTEFLTDTVILRCLIRFGGVDAVQVRHLRTDAAHDRARSSAHVGKWTTSGIAQDWQGFQRDAVDIR